MDGKRGGSIAEDSNGGYGFKKASMYILEQLFHFGALETRRRHRFIITCG